MAEHTRTGAAPQTRREFLAVLGAGTVTKVAGGSDGHSLAGSGSDESLTTSHAVRIDDRRTELSVEVPRARYRATTAAAHSFSKAFAASHDQPYLGPVTADLAARTSDRAGAIRAAQSLTASIEYMTDEASTGSVEFVRYPAETLVAGLGDCEDVAILLAGLLGRSPLDCRTALLVVPGHCATLVARADLPAELISTDPVTVALGGTEYVYAEAVRPIPFGRAAKDYGSRPHVAVYNDRWIVLDADVLVEWGREEFDRRGLDLVGAVTH